MKIYFLSFLLFLTTASYSVLSVRMRTCGTTSFHVTGTDATGRNIYEDGIAFSGIHWNTVSNIWEIVILPSQAWFSNSFASTPNPPCFTTGTWLNVDTSSCGTIISMSGDCQATLVGVNELSDRSSIHVFPNPSNRSFNFDGIENGNSIEVFDITGRMVFETISKPGSYTVDMNEKNKGVYLFTVKKENTIVKQGKLVLQ